MRTMAFCSDCNKRRQIQVEIEAVKIYQPYTGRMFYADTEDGRVVCRTCHKSHLTLSRDEVDELISFAWDMY